MGKLKIAILGTRGIPNQYGGFEQFAEKLSVQLVKRGHTVTVYNPNFHPYEKPTFDGVTIQPIYSPENFLGSAANFIYDFLCLIHAKRRKYDIYLELGYASVAIFLPFIGMGNGKIVTNMDGIEWKRDKWSPLAKKITKRFEKLAVKYSHHIISDNIGIQDYYWDTYKVKSSYIPYPAELFDTFDSTVLDEYGLQKNDFFLIIARLEKENNIEMVLQGYIDSNIDKPFIIIGNHQTQYGQYLTRKFGDLRIKFIGGIYNDNKLNSLRHFASIYFHGHSVGGTNPSLLEAMACKTFIIAHDNIFNKSVLGKEHSYFTNPEEVKHLFSRREKLLLNKALLVKNNSDKISKEYNINLICDYYEDVFSNLMRE